MDDSKSARKLTELNVPRLRRRLLAWYRKSARDLPWRRTRDPYKVWVSEIMLQQTQVDTVVDYYHRFLQVFPTLEALAAADERRVLQLWEGLGYYRRARHLHAAAKKLVEDHEGRFPQDVQALRALPGVGKYTAGAVLSLAFDQRQPILEANTVRLLSRLIALECSPLTSASQRQLWSVAERLLPTKGGGSGATNQALMELGSRICQPRQPLCQQCPLATDCLALHRNLVEKIPEATRKLSYESRTEAAIVIRRGRHVLLRQCQANERWAGLWDFPRFHLKSSRRNALRELQQLSSDMTGQTLAIGTRLTTLRHGVTRYRITLDCYLAEFRERPRRLRPPFRWVKLAELPDFPLNVTGRKIGRLLV